MRPSAKQRDSWNWFEYLFEFYNMHTILFVVYLLRLLFRNIRMHTLWKFLLLKTARMSESQNEISNRFICVYRRRRLRIVVSVEKVIIGIKEFIIIRFRRRSRLAWRYFNDTLILSRLITMMSTLRIFPIMIKVYYANIVQELPSLETRKQLVKAINFFFFCF